ncbi:MAG TPA: host attachment protein [Reyranella sp.]|jgi:protein required for attachment to host cells|nr:host attachment protein [Reyranella sp.]
MVKSVMKPRRKARLPAAPQMEPLRKRTLIVVADSARARFLEPSDDTRKLVPASQLDMVSPTSRRPTRALVTDKPGRGFRSAGGRTRHAYEQTHDVHKLEKHKFVESLAETLDDICARGEFDRMVLVAPSRSLGELRGLLSPRVRRMVSHEVPKDLTASTPTSLKRALASILPTPVVSPP